MPVRMANLYETQGFNFNPKKGQNDPDFLSAPADSFKHQFI